jgi:hypothetical protein
MAVTITVDLILADMGIALGHGIGNKEVVLAAVEFWELLYRQSVQEALNQGADYRKDRKLVLKMATKLGKTARRLAGSGKITKTVAKKASKIIANDPECPAGGGRYCPAA